MPIDLNRDTEQPVPGRQCPCGEKAVWYSVTPQEQHDAFHGSEVEVSKPTTGATNIGSADLTDDLCDDCFDSAITPTERGLWTRYTGA